MKIRRIDTRSASAQDRYQLLTSLVVPRPIAWISTVSAHGVPNIAPFSYFAALSPTPMLVGVSIGSRGGVGKDTLLNVRETGGFCVNVVTEAQLEVMNATSAEHPPEVDEFDDAGLPLAWAEEVNAPYVLSCPAVLECELRQEVPLFGGPNTLVIGEVLAVRLDERLEMEPGTQRVSADALRPVGRLGGDLYAPLGQLIALPRPKLPDV